MLKDLAEQSSKALFPLLWKRYGHLSGPVMRLGSYGWAYAAQFALTLVMGVEAFAVYVAATALGMLCAYGTMAGVTDLLTRQWTWLISEPTNLRRSLVRFVAPRLVLAFVVTAAAALLLQRTGWIQASGTSHFWLLVATFGLLAVTIDVGGVLLACLGVPSFHLIVSNGLLGTVFFAAAGLALAIDARPDLLAFHVSAQVLALVIIAVWLCILISRTLGSGSRSPLVAAARPDLKTGVTITAVHVLEILRNHLPILAIQAAFQNPIGAALVTSLRFSRAVDVMGSLAVAQCTRAIVTSDPSQIPENRRRAQRLCLALSATALLPISAIVVVMCLREGLGWAMTAFIAVVVIGSGMLRQLTTIEMWLAKVVGDPGPAFRIGLLMETSRFAVFGALAALAGLHAAVLALVAHDALLLAAMLKLDQKAGRDA